VDLLIRNATILTMNDRWEVVENGGVLVRDGLIVDVGSHVTLESVNAAVTSANPGKLTNSDESATAGKSTNAGDAGVTVIDAAQGYLLPGFVQTHIHLCQTLFRGSADDLALLDWLKRRVWPLEAAHAPDTLRASTRLAVAELLRTGTTSVLTMETVHETEAVLETLAETGIRATVGKCLMDAAPDAPSRLQEDRGRGIDASLALHKQWHGAAGGRLRIALAPRFAVSCSRELLEAVAAEAERLDVLVHTHASENRDEVALVRSRTGLANVDYLAETGLATERLCAAHCVWVSDDEQALMAERDVKVLHCPGSNLKLGSGVAPVVDMRARGISVSLGADGAACNNRLDMFDEMRLAATLQAMSRGPGTLTARDVLHMATREGARALGLDREIGSIEKGKRADFIIVDRHAPHLAPGLDPYSTLVYAARGADVRTTVVNGDVLVRDFELTGMDARQNSAEAHTAAARLRSRAGL
jgi:5-methylthioadenosine/S-adenosylhomocysteine deaminase